MIVLYNHSGMLHDSVFLPWLAAHIGKDNTYSHTLLYQGPPPVVESFSQPLWNVYSIVVIPL